MKAKYMVIANIVEELDADHWQKQLIQISKSKCNHPTESGTLVQILYAVRCGRIQTWCQFEVVFALGSHSIAVAATVVPGHVYPAVVNVASNNKLLWDTSLKITAGILHFNQCCCCQNNGSRPNKITPNACRLCFRSWHWQYGYGLRSAL
jgi:hypothetical protein